MFDQLDLVLHQGKYSPTDEEWEREYDAYLESIYMEQQMERLVDQQIEKQFVKEV